MLAGRGSSFSPDEARILDGQAIANDSLEKLKERASRFRTQHDRPPGLSVVLVGSDQASSVYVRKKREACERVGIESRQFDLPADTSQEEMLAIVDKLNEDPATDGILVQLPLPAHIDGDSVLERVAPHKDVDGFHPFNLGRLAARLPGLRCCTPHGVMKLLHHTKDMLQGKHAVVVGASNHVGRPMSLELLAADCTVTTCHAFTQDLLLFVASADILIVAVGKPNLIRGEWVKRGATVIDIGINRMPDGSLCGDVDFAEARQRAAWITPVPGGVGPMTVATLLENTVDAAEELYYGEPSATDKFNQLL
jgi:methylenetetrahydrofolate dehydrogenase (NADP+)/methenyltetrahydrofolate cyclohydrolase